MDKKANEKQLAALKQTFTSLIERRFPPSSRPAIDLDIQRDVIDEFNCEKVLSILVGGQITTYGLRSALLSALRVWVICPQDKRLIRSAVAQSVCRSLANAEKKFREIDSDIGQLGDILTRLNIDPDFYSTLYYPIGAMSSIINARTKSSIARELRENIKAIQTACALMAIFHYHASALTRDDFGQPSVRLATKLLATNHVTADGKKNLGDRSISALWSKHKASAPFWYAASMMRMQDEKPLLTKIATQASISTETLKRWLGIVRYLNESVMSCMHKDVSELSIRIPPTILSIAVPAPSMPAEEILAIETIFVRKRSELSKNYEKKNFRFYEDA